MSLCTDREAPVACPFIAGVDEAGRGALAGPVAAAAVMLSTRTPGRELTDSKQLTPKQRESAELVIKETAVAWALGWASVSEIDTLNILQATLLAMRRAVDALNLRPSAIWVDGNQAPDAHRVCRTVVRGDAVQPAISAASILAKVARDRILMDLDTCYPGFDFASNKGYGTAGHRRALAEHGPAVAHRAQFAPVARSQSNRQLDLDIL